MVRVLLGLVKMTLGDTVEGVAGVGVTVLGFTVPCGRFDPLLCVELGLELFEFRSREPLDIRLGLIPTHNI